MFLTQNEEIRLFCTGFELFKLRMDGTYRLKLHCNLLCVRVCVCSTYTTCFECVFDALSYMNPGDKVDGCLVK